MQVRSKNGGKIPHFLWKIEKRWWRCLYELFVPHVGYKHRYAFYLAAIGGLVTRNGRLPKNEELEVKHIASRKVLPAAE